MGVIRMQLGHRKCCLDVSGNVFLCVKWCGAIVSSPHHSTNGDYVGDSLVLGAMDHLFCQKKLNRGWQEPNISEHLISLMAYKD